MRGCRRGFIAPGVKPFRRFRRPSGLFELGPPRNWPQETRTRSLGASFAPGVCPLPYKARLRPGFFCGRVAGAGGGLFHPERDAALAQVIGRHLHLDPVTGQDADIEFAHLPGNMGGDNVVIVQLHAEHGVRKGFQNHPFQFNLLFFRHPVKFRSSASEGAQLCRKWTYRAKAIDGYPPSEVCSRQRPSRSSSSGWYWLL